LQKTVKIFCGFRLTFYLCGRRIKKDFLGAQRAQNVFTIFKRYEANERCARFSKTGKQMLDLKGIFSHYDLNAGEMADLLFPNNQHKKAALTRALKGEYTLDANQLSRLAAYIGVYTDNLFTPYWISKPAKDHILKFSSGLYWAELDTRDFTTRLFHKKSLFHTVVLAPQVLTLPEYVNKLNSIIENFNQNASNSSI
jgi:hypothetical protein